MPSSSRSSLQSSTSSSPAKRRSSGKSSEKRNKRGKQGPQKDSDYRDPYVNVADGSEHASTVMMCAADHTDSVTSLQLRYTPPRWKEPLDPRRVLSSMQPGLHFTFAHHREFMSCAAV